MGLLRWFWQSHDPTQYMAQGNDTGTQYRTALFFFDDEQRQLFETSKAAYQEALRSAGKGAGKAITTEITAAADFGQLFYYAEDYHQQSLAKPGERPYCSAMPQEVHLPSFDSWATPALQEQYAPKLDEGFWQEHAPKRHCVIRAVNEPIKWPAA